MDFLQTPRGLFALAVFVMGTALYSGPSIASTAAHIPWEYMPAATANAAWKFYEVNFFPLAEMYLEGVDQVGDLQADAYATLGKGVAIGVTAAASAPPVAAAAQWYVETEQTINTKLSK